MQSIQSAPWLYSSLAEDPDLAPQVELFVSRLPQRVESLRSIMKNQDWETLGQRAQQLKGSGTSYGFEKVAHFAAQLKDTCQETRQENLILESLDELLNVCSQVRAGTPGQCVGLAPSSNRHDPTPLQPALKLLPAKRPNKAPARPPRR